MEGNPVLYKDPSGHLAQAIANPYNWVMAGLSIYLTWKVAQVVVNNSDSSSSADNDSKTKFCAEADNGCPPCKTISGKTVAVGTIGYRTLEIIPDTQMQHGVYGSHHNIFIAQQAPKNTPSPCRCFWQKQKYVLKPAQLTGNMMPVEEFIY